MSEPKTVDFYLGAHLTFTVDESGKVIALEIMPYSDSPVCENYPDWVGDDLELVDPIEELASNQGWAFAPLNQLPEGIRWEA